jgi:LPS export ABC transporter protein LptC
MRRRYTSLLALGLLVGGCWRQEPQPLSAKPSPGVEMVGARFIETAEGKKVWEIEAKRVDYSADAKRAVFNQVVAHFYEAGRVVSEGLAPQGVFDLRDRRLNLKGGIHIKTVDNQAQFQADNVQWLPASGRLSATGAVHYTRGGQIWQSSRLEADRALRNVKLLNGVNGQVALFPGTLLPLSASIPGEKR